MPVDTERLRKSIRKVRNFLKTPPKNPTPDQIHEVRTGTRRLEAALDTLHIKKKRATKKSLQRELERIRERCGKLRDMDVPTAHAMSVTPEESERECLVHLLEYLGANRYWHARKLRKTTKKYGAALRKDLAKLAKKVDKLSARKEGNGRGLVTDWQNVSALKELAAELQSPARLDKNNLHPYRLKVKELRYAMQLSEEAQHDELVARLGRVKDAIGQWHDWEELVEIATEIIGHGPQSKLLRQLKRISEEKCEKALDITDEMRSLYNKGKRRGTSGNKEPTPFPVVMVKSAARA
jgi:CHAD domain-containing protein